MHELALATEVVSICAARADGARVTRVRLEVGRLAAVLPDALRFCFDACANGTLVEGASLDIIETPGQELRVKDMEVD
jgi:hydrogenase nickel incorporation protein HypA/HybF